MVASLLDLQGIEALPAEACGLGLTLESVLLGTGSASRSI